MGAYMDASRLCKRYLKKAIEDTAAVLYPALLQTGFCLRALMEFAGGGLISCESSKD